MSWTYSATVVRVVDGDTIECDVDVGFHMRTRQRFRLMGYNAPEMRGAERSMGVIAQRDLDDMLFGVDVELRTHKGDAFGRWLCDVHVDGVDLVESLITAGYGVAWDGRGKRPAFDPDTPYPLVT